MKKTLLVTGLVSLALCTSALANDVQIAKQDAQTFQIQVSAGSQNQKPLSLYQDERTILEKLMAPTNKQREGRFYNSRVDLAPKSWPYPMVVNTRRPVLPGSAW